MPSNPRTLGPIPTNPRFCTPKNGPYLGDQRDKRDKRLNCMGETRSLHMLIEEMPRLARKTLARANALNPGAVTAWGWVAQNLSILVTATPAGFTISDGEREVRVDLRPGKGFGSMVCPSCGKGVRYLLRRSTWGCRHCCGVYYRSQHPEAYKRIMRRIGDVYHRACARQRRRDGPANR
jgi:hypothetical protein